MDAAVDNKATLGQELIDLIDRTKAAVKFSSSFAKTQAQLSEIGIAVYVYV